MEIVYSHKLLFIPKEKSPNLKIPGILQPYEQPYFN